MSLRAVLRPSACWLLQSVSDVGAGDMYAVVSIRSTLRVVRILNCRLHCCFVFDCVMCRSKVIIGSAYNRYFIHGSIP